MAVILGASATNIIANLVQSMSELQKQAVPSDIAQMHAGEIDQVEIDKFTEEQRENIAMQETVVLLNVAGRNIYFGENETMDGPIQLSSFVVQNKKFNFILNLDNEKLDVKDGKVAVPIYLMEQFDLNK